MPMCVCVCVVSVCMCVYGSQLLTWSGGASGSHSGD